MTAHLDETLPFLVNRIAQKMAESVNREFRPLGVNVFAARVLILLYLNEASTMGDIATKASLEQSTISHIVRRLHTDGLLSRERLEHDNRSVMISLTKLGRETAIKCWQSVEKHDKLMRQGLDAAENNAIRRLLVQVYENVPIFNEEVSAGTSKKKNAARIPARFPK